VAFGLVLWICCDVYLNRAIKVKEAENAEQAATKLDDTIIDDGAETKGIEESQVVEQHAFHVEMSDVQDPSLMVASAYQTPLPSRQASPEPEREE